MRRPAPASAARRSSTRCATWNAPTSLPSRPSVVCFDYPYQDFHVYTIEWDATAITWSIDGTNYHRATPASIPSGTQWVFDHPFFIILNVAVGGNRVGAPNASTAFPQVMLVDYVRVFADAAE